MPKLWLYKKNDFIKRPHNLSAFQTLKIFERTLTKALLIGFANDYLGALKVGSRVLVTEPFVESHLIDFLYYGHCAIIKLENLRAKLMKNGSGEKDENFSLVLWLKVK